LHAGLHLNPNTSFGDCTSSSLDISMVTGARGAGGAYREQNNMSIQTGAIDEFASHLELFQQLACLSKNC